MYDDDSAIGGSENNSFGDDTKSMKTSTESMLAKMTAKLGQAPPPCLATDSQETLTKLGNSLKSHPNDEYKELSAKLHSILSDLVCSLYRFPYRFDSIEVN